MITADADWIGPGELFHPIFDRIPDQTNGRLHRKDPGSSANHFFKDIVLRGSAHPIFFESELFGRRLKHGEHNTCHGIDRESHTNPVEWDFPKGHPKTYQGIDSHT